MPELSPTPVAGYSLNCMKILNDPVLGFISIPHPLLLRLVDHPWFQRLRYIKQLGLSHLVYPGALHTRLPHAIGAMHLMGLAIESLREKGHAITEEEALGARIAILLHDIRSYGETIRLQADDVLTWLYPPQTGGAVRDLFGALLHGAELVVMDPGSLGLGGIARTVQQVMITLITGERRLYPRV